MVYLACQHAIRMIIMWYDGWYPPLNELSDSTWHMFTHVVETKINIAFTICMFMVDYILLMLALGVD